MFLLFIEVLYNLLFNIRLTKINYPLECEIRKSNVSVDIRNREMNCVMCHIYGSDAKQQFNIVQTEKISYGPS